MSSREVRFMWPVSDCLCLGLSCRLPHTSALILIKQGEGGHPVLLLLLLWLLSCRMSVSGQFMVDENKDTEKFIIVFQILGSFVFLKLSLLCFE